VRLACAQAQQELRAADPTAAQPAVVEAANFNAPAQVVIAGHNAALARACEIVREMGAKRAMLLPVSVAFHTSLLEPAREHLRERLEHVAVKAPVIPVVNNIDVREQTEPSAIRDALARQVAGPVRWTEVVAHLVDRGVTHIVECGPGKVLTGLNKRIAPSITGISVSDWASLQEALSVVGA